MKLPTTAALMVLAGLGLATDARAQSNVSVYGVLDVSVGQFQAAGGAKLWRAQSGGMATSYLGVKGAEELVGGVKAVFALEHYLRIDEGNAGRYDGEAFWARNAYVGLQGEFGTSRLGRNITPLYVSTSSFNAFGGSFGFSPSMRQLFTPATGAGMLPFFGDTSWNNSMSYSSPEFNGLSTRFVANLGEGAAGAAGKNIGANMLYFAGPFGATFAAQEVQNGALGVPAGWTSQATVQLGAWYDLRVAKLFGQFTSVKTNAGVDTRSTIHGFGVAVPMGAGKLLAQYGSATADVGAVEATHKTLSLGYDYVLSANTDVYGVVMHDRATNLAAGNSVATGVRMRF